MMASNPTATDPINSEPVIVHNPDAANSTKPADLSDINPFSPMPKEDITAPELDINARIAQVEKALADNFIPIRGVSPHPPPPPPPNARYYRNRSRSRSPVRPAPPAMLLDTSSIEALLYKSDSLAEVQTGSDFYNRSQVYITTYPFHQRDLEKISWIFKTGLLDTWAKPPKKTNELATYYHNEFPVSRGRRNVEYSDDGQVYVERVDNRNGVPLVALGAVFTLLDDKVPENEDDGEIVNGMEKKTEESLKAIGLEKVKFIIVVQAKGSSSWAKLMTAYSRQAALCTVFHEIMNGQSVLFVGAVLKDIEIPVDVKTVYTVKFKRVESVAEAESVEEGTIGFIC